MKSTLLFCLTLVKKIPTCCFLIASLSWWADAAVLNIEMEFKADIRESNKNEFKNITPSSGYCERWASSCNGAVSMIIPGLTVDKIFDSNSSDKRRNLPYLKVDGQVRNIKLVNNKTGLITTVEFRLALVGMNYVLSSSEQVINRAFGKLGPYPLGDCTGTTAYGPTSWYHFAWRFGEKKSTCYRTASNASADGNLTINDISLGYVLKAQKPLEIPAGEYEGEVVYSIGDGMDLDFGGESYSDSEVKINIKATVEHAFYSHFPPGSENVQLSPPNGWSSWINGGIKPEKLSKEVPFTISSSGGFKVMMQCEYNMGSGCGLKNQASAETVPLDVKMTIPGFSSRQQPVRNLLLSTDPDAHVIDHPKLFVTDLRSKLDFVVDRPGVEKMLAAPGSNWKGVLTLIFDKDIK